MIGAFTLAVMAGIALFVLWLGKFSDQEYAFYDVVFEEAVTGLGKGGAVQYNGIQVGEVFNLSLHPQNPSRVIARVRLVAETPVKIDTRAELGFMGVTGVALIQLSGGSPDSPILLPAEGQEVGTIIADTSDLQRLIEGGGDVFANVNDLLMRMNRVLADENIARISAVVSHVEQVTSSLAGERETIESLLRDSASAARRLERVLARVDDLTGGVESVVNEMDSAVSRHLDSLLAEARGGAEELRQFSSNLRSWMEQSQPHLQRFTRDGLDQVAAAMSNLSRLSRRLEDLARTLEEDPSALFSGGAQPLEYEPEQ